MAEILKQVALERQGPARHHHASPDRGRQLLSDWNADFSGARLRLELPEIEAIIRGAPQGKRGGPDGIPAGAYRPHAQLLAPIYAEAWDELSNCSASEGLVETILGRKIWRLAAKIEGANRPEKLRDLELGNEIRKTLARMMALTLNEVCSSPTAGLTTAQQAFLNGRNIVKNTTALLRDFWAGVDEADTSEGSQLRNLGFVLALDCTKGYNLMDHGWLRAALERAQLPGPLRAVIDAMLINHSILCLNGIESEPVELVSGLTQGCPLSCILYVIGVDPLLAALEHVKLVQPLQEAKINEVSGFVDDWSVAFRGIDMLRHVSELVASFEQASGQRVHRGDKSALIPCRRLTASEVGRCRAMWGGEIRISDDERVLGIRLGLDATVARQYEGALAKCEATLALLHANRKGMSTATRIQATNVFAFSAFAYLNRHFWMPRGIVERVEAQALRFITPIAWAKLRFFSAAAEIYGLRTSLIDLRLTNAAQLLAVGQTAGIGDANAAALSRWHESGGNLANPAVSWWTAVEFYQATVGQSYVHTWRERYGDEAMDRRLHRFLYRRMCMAEADDWRGYVRARVAAKGWDGTALLHELRQMPRSMPQGHRWFLMQVHLNAPITSGRSAAAGICAAESCAFCGIGVDSIAHLASCPLVLDAYDQIRQKASLPPLVGGQRALMLQEPAEGAERCAVTAVFAAAWRLRSTVRRCPSRVTGQKVAALLLTCLQCPWLSFCAPTRDRKERRARRVKAPPPVPSDCAVYRSDGACRGPERLTGWGAAYWAPGTQGRGESTATICGHVGLGSTNNIAEYQGVWAALRRAFQEPLEPCIFEVDSYLVAEQLNGRWSCRNGDLVGMHSECRHILDALTKRGQKWQLLHIYREFNTTADQLANAGVDLPGGPGEIQSRGWFS